MVELRSATLQQFRAQQRNEPRAYSSKMAAALHRDPSQRQTYDLSKYFPHASSPSPSKTSDSGSVKSPNHSSVKSPAHSASQSASPAHYPGAKPQWEPQDSSTPLVPKSYSRSQRERMKAINSGSPSLSPSHGNSFHGNLSPQGPQGSPVHSASSPGAGSNCASTNSASPDLSNRLAPGPVSGSDSSDSVARRLSPALHRAISVPDTGALPPAPRARSDPGTALRHDGRTDSLITGSSDSIPR